jgi:hypothetical protein
VNSYERVMTALEHGEPDHVPIVEWAVSPSTIRAMCPQAKDQSDLEEMLETHPESPMATALSRFGGPNARY